MKLRRGFRKEAEEYALEYRSELQLEEYDPLDPMALADHLAIPVHKLSDLSAHPDQVNGWPMSLGSSGFSAAALSFGTRREIIYNDYKGLNRQRSSVAHEIAHIILGHPPCPPLIGDDLRRFDSIVEKEANELGFTLLIPKIAALLAVEEFLTLREASRYFGVSDQLLEYRIRITNARGWAANRARKTRVDST